MQHPNPGSRLKGSFQAVPALDPPRSGEAIEAIVAEEFAQAGAPDGLKGLDDEHEGGEAGA